MVLRRLDDIDSFSALNERRAGVRLSPRRQAAPETQEASPAFVFLLFLTISSAPTAIMPPNHCTKCFIVAAKQLKVINNFETQ